MNSSGGARRSGVAAASWCLVMVAVFSGVDKGVWAMPAGKYPQQRRGILAWDNVQAGCPWEDDDVNRLLIHSVTDETAVIYMREVRLFLKELKKRGKEGVSYPKLDRLLARRLSSLCYRDKVGRQRGANLLWGMLWSFPELRTHLFYSVRAMKSWEKIVPGGEGGPIAEEGIWCVMCDCFREGLLLQGVLCALSYDCYLRSSDWAGLQEGDGTCTRQSVSLVFGVQERGASAKTGINQGVVISRGWIAEMVEEVLKLTAVGAPMFPISQPKFRAQFQKLWRRRGKKVRAVHDLRHSGAAEDVAQGRRTLDGVQRRGRWRHLSACTRYTKTFLIARSRGMLGEEMLKEGRRIAEDPRRAVRRAIEEGEGAKTKLGLAISRRFKEGPRIPDSKEDLRPRMQGSRRRKMKDPGIGADENTEPSGAETEVETDLDGWTTEEEDLLEKEEVEHEVRKEGMINEEVEHEVRKEHLLEKEMRKWM